MNHSRAFLPFAVPRMVLPGVLLAWSLLLSPASLRGKETALAPAVASEEQAPADIYARSSPAVVGIECFGETRTAEAAEAIREDVGEEFSGRNEAVAFGTGVIISPEGLVLTSITVAPPAVKRIRVQLRGGRRLDAERVRDREEVELVLLRLKAAPEKGPASGGAPFPFLRLGNSSAARLGQLAYALGNAFQSISLDDEVSLSAGTISGGYFLQEKRNQSIYLGRALETTAAVNDGMDGGPLLDGRGEVMGLLCLNFSRNRWLGTAIPINILKPFLADDLGLVGDGWGTRTAYLGLELGPAVLLAPGNAISATVSLPTGALPTGAAPAIDAASGSELAVLRVDPTSPAAKANLRTGDRLRQWNGKGIGRRSEVLPLFEKLRPGERVHLSFQREGAELEADLTAWGSF